MPKDIFSVFYQSPDGFFVCRTDFLSLEIAEKFIISKIFIFDGAVFHFILKNGNTLVKGVPKETTAKFYADSMRYAIEIPAAEIGFST